MKEFSIENNSYPQPTDGMAMVPKEEAFFIRQLRTITKSGYNAEVKQEKDGSLKVYSISKRIAFTLTF